MSSLGISKHAVSPGSGEPCPLISVVIPVRNEARAIKDTLQSLLDQDYPQDRFELLVADGQSTDQTRELVQGIAQQRSQVRLLDNPKRWSSAGRNVAIKASAGELIMIVDGHCQIRDRNFLTNVRDAFERSGADCLGRPQPLDVIGATSLQLAIASARSSRLGHHPDSFIYSDEERFVPPQSVAVAYRRSVFEKIGLFDESFDACEDVELNYRAHQAGLTCYFTPKIVVKYHPRGTLKGLLRQLIRYGRGRARLLKKHPGTFSIGSLVPALFIVGVLVGGLLSVWVPMLRIPYFAVLGIYAAAVLLTSLSIGIKQRSLSQGLLLPLVFVTVHFASGYGVLRELFWGHKLAKHVERLQPRSTAQAGPSPQFASKEAVPT